MRLPPFSRLLPRQLSLRSKILLGLLTALGAAVVGSVVAYQALAVGALTATRTHQTMRIITLAMELRRDVLECLSSELSFLVAGSDGSTGQGRCSVENFEKTSAAVKLTVAEDARQVGRIEHVEQLFRDWRQEVEDRILPAPRPAAVRQAHLLQEAYLVFLRVRQAEVDHRLSSRPDDLLRWEKELSSLGPLITAAINLERETGKSGNLQKLAGLLAEYHRAYLDPMEDPPRRYHHLAATIGGILHDWADVHQAMEVRAAELVASGADKFLVDGVRHAVEDFITQEQAQLAEQIAASEATARLGKVVGVAGPGLALTLGLIIFLRLSLSVARSVQSVAGAAQGLAAGDLSRRAEVRGGDEIGVLAQAFNSMASSLTTRNRELELLKQMSEMLQVCLTPEEAFSVIARLGAQLFPDEAGSLLWIRDPSGLFPEASVWPDADLRRTAVEFAAEDCWALRRGVAHLVQPGGPNLPCRHLCEPAPPIYLCLPLQAQGEVVGVLHLARRPGAKGAPTAFDETRIRLASATAEQIGLGLGNIRLRQILRNQSIRDPLTGLFNRRYLEEALENELSRAERGGRPLGIILLDIDHFKSVNDAFGHEVGDALLRNLSALLKVRLRKEDFLCRYGGEEFVLMMAEASLEATRLRAEEIRDLVRQYRTPREVMGLGAITISLGVAAYPIHGRTGEELLQVADAALYRAKVGGRDRVELGEAPRALELRTRRRERGPKRPLRPAGPPLDEPRA